MQHVSFLVIKVAPTYFTFNFYFVERFEPQENRGETNTQIQILVSSQVSSQVSSEGKQKKSFNKFRAGRSH